LVSRFCTSAAVRFPAWSRFSISEIGLQNLIGVRNGNVGDPKHFKPKLVCGHARLLALKSLGHDEAICNVLMDDETEAKLVEIDENLCRSDLTQAQRDQHILLRKALWEKQQAEIDASDSRDTDVPPVKPRGHQQSKGFAAAEAERTGKSKRTINRRLAKAEGKEPKPKVKPKAEPEEAVEAPPIEDRDYSIVDRAIAGEGPADPEEMSSEEWASEQMATSGIWDFALACDEAVPELAASFVGQEKKKPTIAETEEHVRTIRRWLDAFEAALKHREAA
jgi:hypothetical protein